MPDKASWRDSRANTALTFVVAAGVVYLAATLGYVLTMRPAGVVFLWPPSGVVLAALLLLDRREWPAVIAGALVGNVITDWQHGASLPLALAGSATNATEQLVAAAVLQRLAGREIGFTSLRQIAGLIAVVLVSNAVTALLGAFVITQYTTAGYWRAWLSWWTGDGMGMLLVAPPIVAWVRGLRARRVVSGRTALEFVVVVAATLALSTLLLVTAHATPGLGALQGHAYLAYPLLIWAGTRLGPIGATTTTLALAGAIAVFAVRGALPPEFGGASPAHQVFEIYAYLSLAALAALVPAAAVEEAAAAERGRRESETMFREIAHHIAEAFFIVEVETRRAVYVNPAWAAIWGRPVERGYDSAAWLEAVHPGDRPALQDAMRSVTRAQAATVTFRIVRPDGSVRWLEGRTYPVHRDDGPARHVVGLVADRTELRRSEERYLQAQKMEAVGRLAGGVAHDFNNLLTVMIGEADELAEAALTPSDRQSVEAIRHAADSAVSLTRQLLAFSRRQIVEPTVFDLNAGVDDTAKMLRRLIGEDVQLDLNLATEPLNVLFDRGQLEQLLTNLAVNARDAMPSGGTVVISTRDVVHALGQGEGAEPPPSGRWVVLEMADTGAGMPEDVLARAFEPFFTTKEVGRGTGLGLATCHGIVTQAGGWISLRSTPGSGTRVTVGFPAADLPTDASPAPAPAPTGGRERILLVEDDVAVRRVTARMLESHGYRVTEATDAAQAIDFAAQADAHFDAIVTDVILPGIGGRELVEMVRATHPGLPALFITGYTDDVILRQQALTHDAAVLAKPFSGAALTARLRGILDADGSRG